MRYLLFKSNILLSFAKIRNLYFLLFCSRVILCFLYFSMGNLSPRSWCVPPHSTTLATSLKPAQVQYQIWTISSVVFWIYRQAHRQKIRHPVSLLYRIIEQNSKATLVTTPRVGNYSSVGEWKTPSRWTTIGLDLEKLNPYWSLNLTFR